MDKYLLKTLKDSGLPDKESQVYLAIIEKGEARISDISQITHLKRPIIYVTIDNLLNKGLVSIVPERKIKSFQAVDVSVIYNRLSTATKNFQEMLPVFKAMQNRQTSSRMIRFYDTKEGILNVYSEMARAKTVYFVSSYVHIEKAVPGIMEEWSRESKLFKRKQESKYLIPDTSDEIELVKKSFKSSKNVRALKALRDLKIDFTLYDDKIGLSSLEEDLFIVVFESRNMVSSMKLFFDLAWMQGREI